VRIRALVVLGSLLGCGPAARRELRGDGPPVACAPTVCVERELACGGSHVERVNGRQVIVLDGGLDCVGPRQVECVWPADRRKLVAADASDIVGLGVDRFRYLRTDGPGTSPVTVDRGRTTVERGGAPRTYGPFGPYGRTAQSADGRIAIEADGDPALTALVARDTVAGRELARVPLEPPFAPTTRPQTFASASGARFGICAQDGKRFAWHERGRTLDLPRGSCIAASPELDRLAIRTGLDEITSIDLGTGALQRVRGRMAAFTRDGLLVLDDHGDLRLAAGAPLARAPFAIDRIEVAPDSSAVALLREPETGRAARALVIDLRSRTSYEVPVPADSVAITLVPVSSCAR